jgi:hypothetical protein
MARLVEALTSSTALAPAAEPGRVAYSVHEAADLLGVDCFSVYRLIQRGKLRSKPMPIPRTCRPHAAGRKNNFLEVLGVSPNFIALFPARDR